MNLNYAIFRSEPIMTINDLAVIGSHNKREKSSYKSNSDINIEKSKYNVELVSLTDKYVKDLQDKMKTNKSILFDKEYVKRNKEIFDSMNKLVNNSTKVMNL